MFNPINTELGIGFILELLLYTEEKYKETKDEKYAAALEKICNIINFSSILITEEEVRDLCNCRSDLFLLQPLYNDIKFKLKKILRQH